MQSSKEASDGNVRSPAQVVVPGDALEIVIDRFVGQRVTRVGWIAKTNWKGEDVVANLAQASSHSLWRIGQSTNLRKHA